MNIRKTSHEANAQTSLPRVSGLTSRSIQQTHKGSAKQEDMLGDEGPKNQRIASQTPRPSEPVARGSSPSKDARIAADQEKQVIEAQLQLGCILREARALAARIAVLHNKPAHADEVCAMADSLIDDVNIRRAVKLAAELVVLGECKIPTHVMLGGRLSDEDKRKYIFPINDRTVEYLAHVEGAEEIAQAISGRQSTGITPYFHACRDISAMAAPRAWRRDAAHPDGRLTLDEISAELKKNDARPGRDPAVTQALLAAYAASLT